VQTVPFHSKTDLLFLRMLTAVPPLQTLVVIGQILVC
jgi:hypothetical protein